MLKIKTITRKEPLNLNKIEKLESMIDSQMCIVGELDHAIDKNRSQ